MANCTSCGADVTGKKFCPQCGTPVQPPAIQNASNQPASSSTCPRCNGEVKSGAAFCMHCGTALSTSPMVAQPLTRPCPSCRAEVPAESAFCTNCGQNMSVPTPPAAATPAPSFCTNCGHQNNPGVHFCASCGNPLTTAPTAQPQYQQQGPYPQQPQYQQQYPQSYGQPQYQQPYGAYQQDPMLGQQPMALRCPVCMAMAPLGTPNCLSCRTSLAGVVPTPVNIPAQYQQGGIGGMFQGP